MEWVSVERKLPDSGALVLVATGERTTLASWDAVESRFKMMSREDAAVILSGDVTHWTPLPELPQEKHSDWSRESCFRIDAEVKGSLENAILQIDVL